MNVFLLIILGLPILNVGWWWWADCRLRPLRRAKHWRLALAVLMGLNLGLYAWLMLARLRHMDLLLPPAVLAALYTWHLVVLPAFVVAVVAYGVIWLVTSLAGKRAAHRTDEREPASESVTTAVSTDARVSVPADDSIDPPPPVTGPTRRQVLSAALVAVPPVTMFAGQACAMAQLRTFRVRRWDVPLAGLPPTLDGLTIAHVSDVHVGRFTNGRILDDVVTRTNALKPDLVLITGDLIDYALNDLDAGLNMVRRLDSRYGVFMCEGNHDLFQNRREFERRVKASGVPLLLNETVNVRIRSETVQILGLRWGFPTGGRGPFIADQMVSLLPMRQPGAFPILMAHHPHAFDVAAAAGIPLTLSGHTHGGQLMLTKNIGAGPILFKYWSGLYRQGSSALVVSNGVGNWFPLRINAPAEIGVVTLRAMA